MEANRPPIAPSPEGDDAAEARATSAASLEWPRLLAELGRRVVTPFGNSSLRDLSPLPKLGAIRHRLALISEMKTVRTERGPLRFGEVEALTGLLERAERQGRLEPEELAAVLATQRTALQLRAEVQSVPETPGIQAVAGELHQLRDLVDRLGQSLTAAGGLNERFYPELGRLRDEIATRREEIHRKLERLLRTDKLADAFQDQIYTLRGRRYVLPVKADFKGHLPGIVHDVSSSGATLFMEPQSVVDDTNGLARTEGLLELEQDRILRALSWEVGEAAADLRDNLSWIGALDLLHAQAALSEDFQGTAPRVEEEGALDLKQVAHPLMLLEDVARQGQAAEAGAARGGTEQPRVVRNSLALGGEARCMVISGANTGGKTVLLKAVGLCALLVQHGMHIPALAGSRCDRFAAVWADIGDQQSLETSLSTFSAQIRFLTQWLPRAGPQTLVLLDEMLTGTEPTQGAALAGAVLDALLQRGATTLVTTHFGELKELAAAQAGIVNASMAFDPEHLRPTYRLQVGLPGASYALHIARRYGLPDDLVARAEQSLAERPAALDALLVEVQEHERALHREREKLRRHEQQLQQRESALSRERSALDARDRDVRRRERGAVSGELRSARRRIGDVMRELQQANSLPTVSRVREQLAELEREYAAKAASAAAEDRQASAGAKLPENLAPGDAVWLPSLGRRAELDALLDGGERARIRLGSLTLEVERTELAAVPAGEAARGRRAGPTRNHAAASAVETGGAGPEGEPLQAISFALATEDNTLDVRGLRLEEAVTQTEQFFDRCTVKHVSPVMVIHGHGTGRLKAGLREQWQHSPYVLGFRPGEAGEGRDGVTILALNL